MSMIRKFLRNEDGNYAMIFALAALPIFGAVGLSVDYSNLSRLNYNLSDAVDSMCTVVAKEYLDGADNEVAKLAGDNFFRANIDPAYAISATATFTLPDDPANTSGLLKCKGQLSYSPIFGPVMAMLTGGNKDDYVVVINEASMKMKNVAEIALVLDNSGSMAYSKTGQTSGVPAAQQRITLLKAASKKLVTDMIDLGEKMEQATTPVQFSLVPFAAAVNVGPQNANASWMDRRGISPIHHEHLNWGVPGPSNPTGFTSVASDGAKLDVNGNPLTRFSILNALKFRTGGTGQTNQCEVWQNNANGSSGAPNYAQCRVFRRTGTTEVLVNSAAAATATGKSQSFLNTKYRWTGCVEARPNGQDVTDAAPTGANAFVPFFVPDELNYSQYHSSDKTMSGGRNNWWPDYETDTTFRDNAALVANAGGFWAYNDSGQLTTNAFPTTNATVSSFQSGTARPREVNVAKYFVNKPYTSSSAGSYSRFAQSAYFIDKEGPNDGCRTAPITPLTDSKSTLTAAIDAMSATNGTNIPEGLAWGWRTISPGAPFQEGINNAVANGVDKVIIVLTDGANTYSSYDAEDTEDMAGNKSLNYAYGRTGYAGNAGPGGTATASSSSNVARMFFGTTASKTAHDGGNYQTAMDDKMTTLCTNIKNDDIILMLVALDMDPANYPSAQRPAINKAITTMKNCSGASRSKKESNGDPKKLFWNATSDNLDATFKEIADELSNLRFTQ
jgi:Flp pilus assembly protein TadG